MDQERRWDPDSPRHDAAAERNLMIPMWDSMRLANDIYFPARRCPSRSARFRPSLSVSHEKESAVRAAGPKHFVSFGNVVHLRERAAPMISEEVDEIDVDLRATRSVAKAGGRIQMMISSSDLPRIDVNPNTGEKINFHTQQVVARSILDDDPGRPSYIMLLVMPVR